MIALYDDDRVSSCLYMCIPDDMVEDVGGLMVGSMVKVRCYLGYTGGPQWDECCVHLTAESVDEILKVKVVVI